MTVEKNKKKDFFELIVNNPDQAPPFLQFSWCINRMGIRYLQKKQVVNPFLFIKILKLAPYTDRWKNYDHQIYPLDQGLGFFEFSRPGKYRLQAFIIWTNDLTDKKLTEQQSEYKSLPYHDDIEIKIDKNSFIPKPSRHLNWWVITLAQIVNNWWISQVNNLFDRFEDKIVKKQRTNDQNSLFLFYDQRIIPLARNNRIRKATLNSLPKSHRTLRLWFMAVKAKIYKPFRQ